jgi:hypothetical protein
VEGRHGGGLPLQAAHHVDQAPVGPDRRPELEVVVDETGQDLLQAPHPVPGEVGKALHPDQAVDRQDRRVLAGGVHHQHHHSVPRARAPGPVGLLAMGQGGLVPVVAVGDEHRLAPVPAGEVRGHRLHPQPMGDPLLVRELPVRRPGRGPGQQPGLGLAGAPHHGVDGRQVGRRGPHQPKAVLDRGGHGSLMR